VKDYSGTNLFTKIRSTSAIVVGVIAAIMLAAYMLYKVNLEEVYQSDERTKNR